MVEVSTIAAPSAAELVGATVRFGRKVALDGVNLTVERGDLYGLVGPNGAGKTTAFRTLQGLLRPSSGTARLLGQPAFPPNRARNSRVAVQPQESALFEQLTVLEQLTVFARFRGRTRGDAAEVMERLGLADAAGTRQEKLSGGQRQRLSVACAVIGTPEILFLDEPTANVDPVARRDMREFFRELGRDGMTIIYTSHDLNEVASLCDKVTVLLGGRALLTDAPRSISRNLGFTTVDVASRERLDHLQDTKGVVALTVTDEGYIFVTSDDDTLQQRVSSVDPDARVQVRTEPFEETYVRLVREAGATA